jgi:threonine dehydrogenase-like Zn-dependent dehydrogenase
MKATLMYGAGDVRIEDVPDPAIHAPTDAIVRVMRAAICGSDLHPYRSNPPTDVLEGRIEPGRVFDRTVGLDGVPDGYRAMAGRQSFKVLIAP